MAPTIEELRLIAKKILNNVASEEEQRLFWEYFDQTADKEAKETLFELATFKAIPGEPAPAAVQESILRRILHEESLPKEKKTPLIVLNKKTAWLGYAVAAACILLLVAGVWTLWSPFKRPSPLLAVQQWDTLSNEKSSPRTIGLPDGTTIWLNRHSSLLVDKDYSHNRLVRLDGEAYFDVAHSADHPFRVRTGSVTTNVLGTTFNIDTKDTSTRISLVQGSVRVVQSGQNGDTASLVLVPGETVATSGNGASMHRMQTMVSDVAAWTKGDLVINNLPLKEAILKLNEQFHIRVTGSEQLLAGKAVSGVYRHDQPWPIVLKQLLFIHGLHYQVEKEGTILIIP